MPERKRKRPGARWRWTVLAALGVILAGARPLSAQEASEAAVLEVVDRLFEGMRTADSAAVRAVFHPEARMVSTGERDGRPVAQYASVDGFIKAVGGATAPWNERIYDPEVRIDGNLATVWTFYTFHVGDQFSHCGVNAIQLAWTGDGWKIIHITDTRRREGCDPPNGA
jgi:hypothetical protein